MDKNSELTNKVPDAFFAEASQLCINLNEIEPPNNGTSKTEEGTGSRGNCI
ncbi:MAG: hypothetical protein PUP90_10930 [Nostoc sp. S4]|nr:hypothetical protein [Nostoc sp. S4]